MRFHRRLFIVLCALGITGGALLFLGRGDLNATADGLARALRDDIVLGGEDPQYTYVPPRLALLLTEHAGVARAGGHFAADSGEFADALLDSDLLASLLPGESPYAFDSLWSPTAVAGCLSCGMDGGSGGAWRGAAVGGGAGLMVVGGGLPSAGSTEASAVRLQELDELSGLLDPGGEIAQGSSGSPSLSAAAPSAQHERVSGTPLQPGQTPAAGTRDSDAVNPTPVPEPATIVLTGAGLAALLATRRRRRR